MVLLAAASAAPDLLATAWYSSQGVEPVLAPAAGIAFAGLLGWGVQLWPGVALGLLAVQLCAGLGLAAFAMAAAQAAVLFAGASALRRRANFETEPVHPKDWFRLLAAGCLIGLLWHVLRLAWLWHGPDPASAHAAMALPAWGRDVLAMAVLTPAILVWRHAPDWLDSPVRGAEAACLLALTLLLGQALFQDGLAGHAPVAAQAVWLLLPLVWAAVRFGSHAVVLVLCLLALQYAGGAAAAAAAPANSAWVDFALVAAAGLALSAYRSLDLQAGQRLRASEQKLNAMLDASSEALYDWDLLTGRIHHNARWAWLMGPAQPAAKHDLAWFAARVHPHDRERLAEHWRACLQADAALELEYRLRREDGSEFWICHRGKVVQRDAAGRPARMVGSLSDISERKAGAEQLRRDALQLSGLCARAVDAEEELRRELSRELHDRIGQNLTALDVDLEIALQQLSPESRERVHARMDRMRALARATLDSVTDLLAELRPPLLDQFGVAAAVQDICSNFSRRTGIALQFEAPPALPRLAPKTEVAVCRIAQEALVNLGKHARASHVHVALRLEGGELELAVRDDGVGFDPGLPPRRGVRAGLGLHIMRERAAAAGGRLELQSAPGRGTRISANFPVASS